MLLMICMWKNMAYIKLIMDKIQSAVSVVFSGIYSSEFLWIAPCIFTLIDRA